MTGRVGAGAEGALGGVGQLGGQPREGEFHPGAGIGHSLPQISINGLGIGQRSFQSGIFVNQTIDIGKQLPNLLVEELQVLIHPWMLGRDARGVKLSGVSGGRLG